MTTAAEAVRKGPLSAELTPSETQMLASLVIIRELKDGEVLLPQGARDSHLQVVVQGRIEVTHTSEHGHTVLYTLEPGDLVGELSFMDDEPRYAALVTSSGTEVLVLARGDFETLIERSPQIVYKVMRATIMRIAHRSQRRLSLQLREMENYLYRTGAKFVSQ